MGTLNSFDQEGVQLGKDLAKRFLHDETEGALKGSKRSSEHLMYDQVYESIAIRF